MLAYDGEVMKALRGGTGKGVFAEVLIGCVLLDAGDEARADATAKHELLITGDLVIEPQRVDFCFLRDGEVTDQTVEWSKRGWRRDARGDEAIDPNCWLQEGGI